MAAWACDMQLQLTVLSCAVLCYAFICRWWACKPAPVAPASMVALVAQATPQLTAMSSAALVDTASLMSPAVVAAAETARTALQDVQLDVLALVTPRRVKSGSKATIALTLNRQGAPVQNATVFVQMTTRRGARSITLTVPVTTGADGTASVTVPARVQGRKGSRTVVEAFTGEARAMGAKGDVAVVSNRGRIVWSA